MMTTNPRQAPSEQSRTRDVLQQLRKGLDLKLQLGGGTKAEEYLRAAYQAARDPTPLSCPWPQITAYRLAHLLMRRGPKTPWNEVDALLGEASDGDVLGPAPLIYRLISGSKLSSDDKHGRNVQEVYERVRRLALPVEAPAQIDRRHLGDRPLQPEWFNLLETVVYATGLPYQPLEGWCDASQDPFSGMGFESSAWRVIEDAESATPRYPEAIARRRFEERRRALSPCVAISFESARRVLTYPTRGEARQILQPRQARDLRSLLSRRCDHLRDNRTSGAQDPDNAQRQRKRRLCQQLTDAGLKMNDAEFDHWWQNPGHGNRPCASVPILMLVGPNVQRAG